jgi:hypothetical protein
VVIFKAESEDKVFEMFKIWIATVLFLKPEKYRLEELWQQLFYFI